MINKKQFFVLNGDKIMKTIKIIFLSLLGISIPCSLSAMETAMENREKKLETITAIVKKCGNYIKTDCPFQILDALEGKTTLTAAILKSLNTQKIAEEYDLEKETLDELINQISGQQQPKTKITEFLEKFPPQVVDQIKGAVIGAGTVIIGWLIGHGICHPCMEYFEPQTLLEVTPMAIIVGLGIYKGYQSLKVRNAYQNLILNTYLPLGSAALSRIASYFQDKDRIENTNDNEEKGKSKEEEKHEILSTKKRNELFLKFAETLTEAQIRNLPKPNILLLAQHNPNLLTTQTAFIQSLNNEQTEILSQITK